MSFTNFELKEDSATLYGAFWSVEAPIGNVCLIHGFGEHIHRYEEVIRLFNDKGLNVFGIDLLGHGKSEGKQGDIPSYDSFLNSASLLIQKAQNTAPNLPTFLYGHSMGGGIVLKYLISKEHNLQGALVTSPWLRLSLIPPKLKVMVGRLLFRLGINITQQPNLNTDNLSRDPKVGTSYMNDPLVHDYLSTRAFLEITDNGEWLMGKGQLLKTPVLLAHGSDDKITSHIASQEFAKEAGTSVELKIWEGLRHETHLELNKTEVINYYADWLVKQALLNKSSSTN